MQPTAFLSAPISLVFALLVGSLTSAAEPQPPGRVKITAVQMLGYDKTDLPREGYDPSEAVARYVARAADEGAQLVVFPEYLLGRISVPGPQTERISTAAGAGRIYVIVGCWEVFDDQSFANTALLFDRAGQIVGKYRKVHAAVDHHEGNPPWFRPPQGKAPEWFLRNDPEWKMQRGDGFPVFDLDFGRVGILTCYDGWFPETFRMLSLNGAEILVWINGRRGAVEDFIVKSATFQNEVALVATNQAYGAGTMIGQWPAQILAQRPDQGEACITATIDLGHIRTARANSRNRQQRRPELYDKIVKPVGPAEVVADPAPREQAAAPAGGRSAGGAASDPARLARIRAAKLPAIVGPVLFNTPEADAICSALEVFPPDNPWNLLCENWPVHPDSAAIIAAIGAEKPLRSNTDMGFVLVPPDQKRVEVKIVEYPDESDAGPFPVPDNVPIEGWPVSFQRPPGQPLSLAEVQRRPEKYEGDRHAIVVDPVSRMLYEFFTFGKTREGWAAGQASVFDLKSNKLRTLGWTSADAAGLPIFPAVVRHDELRRGRVEHALRVTVVKTRRAFVAPATHFASRHDNPEYPRMGERIRLKADVDIRGFSAEVQTILTALKRYGMFVADNGIDWAVSVAPDPRIPALHEELRKIKGASFEVVVPPQ